VTRIAGLPKPRAPVLLDEALRAACEGVEGITAAEFRSLLSSTDISDIAAGAIHPKTLKAYALSFVEGIRSGRLAGAKPVRGTITTSPHLDLRKERYQRPLLPFSHMASWYSISPRTPASRVSAAARTSRFPCGNRPMSSVPSREINPSTSPCPCPTPPPTATDPQSPQTARGPTQTLPYRG
jgi:hypothetical protein